MLSSCRVHGSCQILSSLLEITTIHLFLFFFSSIKWLFNINLGFHLFYHDLGVLAQRTRGYRCLGAMYDCVVLVQYLFI